MSERSRTVWNGVKQNAHTDVKILEESGQQWNSANVVRRSHSIKLGRVEQHKTVFIVLFSPFTVISNHFFITK